MPLETNYVFVHIYHRRMFTITNKKHSLLKTLCHVLFTTNSQRFFAQINNSTIKAITCYYCIKSDHRVTELSCVLFFRTVQILETIMLAVQLWMDSGVLALFCLVFTSWLPLCCIQHGL